jgi:uncharacterized protein (TIGR03118 family)
MTLQQRINHIAAAVASLALVMGFMQKPAAAQYTITGLVSNQAGKAAWTDPNLVNAWGIALAPTGPFWVADNGTGLSTLYTGTGEPQGLVVTIPPAPGNSVGSPTGMVYNSTSDFVVSENGVSGTAFFIFATLDGTLSGWSPSVSFSEAILAVDNSASGAVYTGLAIATNAVGSFLYAADSKNDRVDMYDGSFNLVKHITDRSIPGSFTPFGIQTIGDQLYVTYANTSGGPGGYIDIYTTQGDFVKRFTSGAPLNQPWGVALAPSNFGKASNDILISNNVNEGTINAFNATTGVFQTTLGDALGTLKINQLWGLAFGAGNSMNGNTNQLFFTAGPDNFADGFFGVITPQ